MNYKNSIWAKRILQLQHDDGSWGYFHTLSNPSPKQPMTTEQALRRLEILGFTYDDKPIRTAVDYLHHCLTGKIQLPDREEKIHNWKIFTDLMLAAWIRRFISNDKTANDIAEKWSEIINAAFKNKVYNNDLYVTTYRNLFGIKPRGDRLVDFVSFYQVSLLTNELNKDLEEAYFDYILEHETGIYYIYNKRLTIFPEKFRSKETGYYIRAIELLAKYDNPELKKKLMFAADWLQENKTEEGKWDLGIKSKDGINFPLSDSWRNENDRIDDCTYRIHSIVNKIIK
ncbi:hypothetical protein [Breznakiella homolactica]|uniref:Squalene cyclase C-terminal domain-containing protein n=1 Tax=Breznakiella homolactica TaxID=2798577 RepID=A0A7T8BC75_9SPIR|nr:hypothetical protein [Breznakiella homolactica]QQO09933.1 hypothetical protein JFL75_03200 [Breznakiella homolactica]